MDTVALRKWMEWKICQIYNFYTFYKLRFWFWLNLPLWEITGHFETFSLRRFTWTMRRFEIVETSLFSTRRWLKKSHQISDIHNSKQFDNWQETKKFTCLEASRFVQYTTEMRIHFHTRVAGAFNVLPKKSGEANCTGCKKVEDDHLWATVMQQTGTGGALARRQQRQAKPGRVH